MKETQKKSWAWRGLYTWYRFLFIFINFNFDFLAFYKMHFQNYFAKRSIKLESFDSQAKFYNICVRVTVQGINSRATQ